MSMAITKHLLRKRTKRRNTMEQELLVAIPEAVANLTKLEKCGII